MATNNSTPERIIVGITGASGVIYGIRALELLAEAGVETHLVISKAAELTMTYETDVRAADLRARASHWYAAGDIGAAISSGSFKTKGMLIVPCSVRSMSEIATGITSSLVSRAADVVLKERRRNAVARRTSAHARAAFGHGRGHRADRPGVLFEAAIDRRHRQSHGRPHARSVRHRNRCGQALERTATRAVMRQ